MPQRTPHIPPEICDHIVDHLHQDKSSLLACGLTSRNLLLVSRYHLFHDLILKLHTADLFSLLSLLTCPSNHIGPFVRRIVIASIPDFIRSYGRSDVVRATRIIPRLLALLSSAESVRFCNSDLERFPEDIALQLFSHFSTFRDLELVAIRFDRFLDFVNLICSFVLLERVRIKWVVWTHCSPSILSLRRSLPSACWYIHGTGGRYVDICTWLSSQGSPPQVHSMLYEAETIEERHRISDFLIRCAASIRHLQIAFPIFLGKERFAEVMHNYINPSGCVNLESLCFKQVLLWPGDETSLALRPWIVKIMNSIPSINVYEIALELYIAPIGNVEKSLQIFDWSGFKKALSHPRFRTLHSITFFVGPRAMDFKKIVNLICYTKLNSFANIIKICHLKTGERFGDA